MNLASVLNMNRSKWTHVLQWLLPSLPPVQPRSRRVGQHHLGPLRAPDLVNWSPLDPAFTCSNAFDANGCWTGSATILPGNRPVILYTGAEGNKRQVQNVAFPKNLSDPLLREWTTPDYNPVIVAPEGIEPTNFRDPTTGWRGDDGYWRIVVGAGANGTGMALLYRSKDFVHWSKAKSPLHSVAGVGMWECPDFFPVALNGTGGLDTSANGTDVRHVLKVSMLRVDYYTVGTYSWEKDVYVPGNGFREGPTGLRFDYGKFYASKTFFDGKKKRRILWGWSDELDGKANDLAKGWAGIQAIPRVVWLDGDVEQLVQWPIKELESLRRKEVTMKGVLESSRLELLMKSKV